MHIPKSTVSYSGFDNRKNRYKRNSAENAERTVYMLHVDEKIDPDRFHVRDYDFGRDIICNQINIVGNIPTRVYSLFIDEVLELHEYQVNLA